MKTYLMCNNYIRLLMLMNSFWKDGKRNWLLQRMS